MACPRPLVAAAAVVLSAALLITESCQSTTASRGSGAREVAAPGTPAHAQEVMRSTFCAGCHPDIFAEHAQNTHGRAFTDEEVRLGTGRFSQGDCIRCHTPRPVFETGIGRNPMRRWHNLEEGNTCMSCHWKPDYPYEHFAGGAQCKEAFDPRVGRVEACASCHRNHGTPYQWEKSPLGKGKGRECIDCHMQKVTRPVAVGEPARRVRSHVFPGGRSESQLRKAYEHAVAVEGNEVVVRIENKGAGHNFPTELKQRSLESLVVVRDAAGKEIARSRLVLRDPYKRPYGLELPVNTQIPSGETRVHRVPLQVATGTVDCELHFKLYYPIEDHHPDLSRRLETKRLVFADITPSEKPVETDPEVKVVTPENIAPELASPAELVDFVRPKIGTVKVDLPTGATPADIARLIDLFQFPVPQANVEARRRLTEIGYPAIPQLIEALGSWDNKTFNQAMGVLEGMGEKAGPQILQAVRNDNLYVRVHARELLGRIGYKGSSSGDQSEVFLALCADLSPQASAVDRASAAHALGELGFTAASGVLQQRLGDVDPDVVRAAALALVKLEARTAIPALREAFARAPFVETRRDLASALGRLGDSSGVSALLDGLDHADDLLRESHFEAFFALTGVHLCYDPLAPRDQRLEALAALRAWWAREGGDQVLRVRKVAGGHKVDAEAWRLISAYAGGDGATAPGDDAKIRTRLLELGDQALPVLVQGMKYPAGFAAKRSKLCEVLGSIGSKDGVPSLVAALRDPVIGVAAWACWAIEQIGDESALPAVQRYHSRLLSLAAAGRIPESAGAPDLLIAQAAAACHRLGDLRVEPDLIGLLLSDNAEAREVAINALRRKHGDDRGYEPKADLEQRRAAASRWMR